MASVHAEAGSDRRLYGLEVGRGLAAIAVLLSHAGVLMGEPRFYGTAFAGGAFEKFGAGVDFFFVLSGFIIAWIHWGDIGRPERLARYAWRRFKRIYPPYWAVLLPLAFAYFVFPDAGEPRQHDPANFVASVLLLPYPLHPILGVAWTLVYEIIFYAIFGLLIWRGRGMLWLLAVWGVATLVVNLAVDRLSYPFSILLDVRNLQFLMGIGAALWVLRRPIPAPRLMTVSGTALFLVQLLGQHPLLDDPMFARFGFGIAAVLAIVGAVGWERRAQGTVLAPLRLLGAASYAIYLVHGIAISATIQVLVRVLPRDVAPTLVFLLLVLAGIGAGIGYHLLVERLLLRWVEAWRRAARPRVRLDHVG